LINRILNERSLDESLPVFSLVNDISSHILDLFDPK
jgi:hypothetical protein